MTTEAVAILVACDRLLGEIGRRDHVFGWLQAPATETTPWIAVDVYYPGNRLVVLCTERTPAEARLCSELIPAHGLRLLEIVAAQAPEDPTALNAMLARRIAELPAVQRPSGELPIRDRAPARPASLLPQPAVQLAPRPPVGESRAAATARGARFVASRQTTTRPRAQQPQAADEAARTKASSVEPADAARETAKPPKRLWSDQAPVQDAVAELGPIAAAAPRPVQATSARQPQARQPQARQPQARKPARRQSLSVPNLLAGLALIAMLFAELYFGVAGFALGAGHVLLAFAIALDCFARVLGTIAAERAGRSDWVWWCAIVGSPAVATFTIYGGEGERLPEPAPLAGLLALSACAAAALSVLTAVL